MLGSARLSVGACFEQAGEDRDIRLRPGIGSFFGIRIEFSFFLFMGH